MSVCTNCSLLLPSNWAEQYCGLNISLILLGNGKSDLLTFFSPPFFLSFCKLFFIHWVLSVFTQLLNRKSFFLSMKFIKIMIKANTMWKERVVYLPSRNDRLAAFSYLFTKNGCTWLLCFHQLCSMWTVDCKQSIEFKWNESLYLKAIFLMICADCLCYNFAL